MRGLQSKQTTLVVFNDYVMPGKLNPKNEECFVTENTLSQKATQHFLVLSQYWNSYLQKRGRTGNKLLRMR